MSPEPIQVAFRVYATDWGMRGHGSRQIDWLVDGKLLHKDNVLFVIDRPRISRAYKKQLESKYHIWDASAWTWRQDYIWQAFVNRWQPKHWVSYNDFHPRHRFRNQVLRAHGCQTWHYSHSVNMPKEGSSLSSSFEALGLLKELDYDHLVIWNEMDAPYFQGGQKHILGPLFSSQVPRLVVAVFDSTWEHYPTNMRERFFTGLYRYLEKNPGMMMLYKPKLKPPPMPDVKNFYVLPEWIEPGLVIGCADLTIGVPGTSPVIEARGAGRHAIYFDPRLSDDVPFFFLPPIQDDPAQRFRELLVK